MTTSGYSGTPLIKKLGIKDGFIMRLVNQPGHYSELLGELSAKTFIVNDAGIKKNFVHYFTTKAEEMKKDLPLLKEEIVADGIIWISWPKKAAKVVTDITEDVIRNEALAIGLVDIKVCAIDEIWSALKLVIPVKDRKKA